MSGNWLHDDPRIIGAKRIAELTVENRQLESDNARLREELSIAQQQLAEARALIKRHEDALEWMVASEEEISFWRKPNGKVVRTRRELCDHSEHDTPLAAIEAARSTTKQEVKA